MNIEEKVVRPSLVTSPKYVFFFQAYQDENDQGIANLQKATTEG